MSGLRNHRAVVGLVAVALAVSTAGLVLTLDGDDPDERDVGAAAARSRPVVTTTPPDVLGDVVIRVPAGEQAEDEPAAAENVAPGPASAEPTAPPTSTAPSPPPPAAPPLPSASAPPAPPSSTPAPPPPTVTPTPTSPPAPAPATIELQREADGLPLQVDLFREGTWIAGGTLEDVLRFEDLPGGPYELRVEWHTGVIVDEENGTAISGSGIARHFIDVREGETMVIHCGEQECEVP